MRIKQRAEDFRVRELLAPGTLSGSGEYRVYRVTKRKQTSLEAAARLAALAGTNAGEISMAGLKDRQGLTTQHMALRHGRTLSVRETDLTIEDAGFAARELSSEASEGNAFEIVVRGLDGAQLAELRTNLAPVREHGLVNYFDDQRFGNLRHNQGWIALMLVRGEHAAALKALLCAISPHDDNRSRAFKSALAKNWGDWGECRDIAGRFGAHHSIFEYLKKNPDDFGGAFFHVATRVRLIHLYAFQSHLWNRAVADFVRQRVPAEQRVVLGSEEGPLVYPPAGPELQPCPESFRLPGPRLEDVTDPVQRALLQDALAAEHLVPAQFDIQGVPGFQIKGEDRALFVHPRHLRVRPAEPDALNRGMRLVKVRFELPRGSYATLVVGRLLTRVGAGEATRSEESAPKRRDTRSSGESHDARDDRDRRGPPRDRDRGPRDARDPRGPRSPGGTRDPRGSRSPAGPRDPRGPRSEERRGNSSERRDPRPFHKRPPPRRSTER